MSDLVLGIINPARYNLPEYRGYNINLLRNRYRGVNIIKNRDGEAEKTVSMLFLGECGYFRELPKKEDMSEQTYKMVMNLK